MSGERVVDVGAPCSAPAADGLWIDGALYPLEGQPPVAKQGSNRKPYGT